MGAATLTQASALSHGHDKMEKSSAILMLLFALLEVPFFDAQTMPIATIKLSLA
jgi:hypothetical protein